MQSEFNISGIIEAARATAYDLILMDMAMQFVMMVCSTQTADHILLCSRAPLIGTVRDQQ